MEAPIPDMSLGDKASLHVISISSDKQQLSHNIAASKVLPIIIIIMIPKLLIIVIIIPKLLIIIIIHYSSEVAYHYYDYDYDYDYDYYHINNDKRLCITRVA